METTAQETRRKPQVSLFPKGSAGPGASRDTGDGHDGAAGRLPSADGGAAPPGPAAAGAGGPGPAARGGRQRERAQRAGGAGRAEPA